MYSDSTSSSWRTRVYDYKRKVRKSHTAPEKSIKVSLNSLDKSRWEEFYKEVYLPWVANKTAGFDYAGLEFPESVVCGGGDIENFSLLEFRDDSKQSQIIAGVLLERFRKENILKIKFAAFSRSDEYPKLYMSHRAHNEAVKIAESEGFSILSYGTEPNLYAPEGKADMITIGLHNFKASLCFEPVVLNIPGYRENRLLRLLSKKWKQESECFFYQYKYDGSGLEVYTYGTQNRIRCPYGVKIISNE